MGVLSSKKLVAPQRDTDDGLLKRRLAPKRHLDSECGPGLVDAVRFGRSFRVFSRCLASPGLAFLVLSELFVASSVLH